MNDRSGMYKSNLSGELRYQSFMPLSLPPNPPIQLDEEAIQLLIKANRSLGILEGI